MSGNISFFENDVPLAFKSVTDPKLLADFHGQQSVIASLKDYEQWMKKDLLPRYKGDFRLGRATYTKKLQYEEMVDIPSIVSCRSVTTISMQTRKFAETAARIDPKKTPKQILDEMEKDHPPLTNCWTRFATPWRADEVIKIARSSRSSPAPADSGGNAALHARADLRVHGYALVRTRSPRKLSSM
jgi:hypothetical protein